MADTKKKATLWQTIKPYSNGGTAGMMATCVIQPIDMIKVESQPDRELRAPSSLALRSLGDLQVHDDSWRSRLLVVSSLQQTRGTLV